MSWQLAAARDQKRDQSCGASSGDPHERPDRQEARGSGARDQRIGTVSMKRPIAAVVGTGRGLPAHVMTNHDFASIGIETSHEWIFERSGIVERRLARNGETTCSMAADAARKAMNAAGVHPGEIDVIVLSTATPDRLLPSTAVDIQAELGATRAAAFDIGAACSGWLY